MQPSFFAPDQVSSSFLRHEYCFQREPADKFHRDGRLCSIGISFPPCEPIARIGLSRHSNKSI